MYMTARERAMQFAQHQGYFAYPYGTVPSIYRGKEAEHLKAAWESGYQQARQAYYW